MTFKRTMLHLGLIAGFSFAGGFAGQVALGIHASQAQDKDPSPVYGGVLSSAPDKNDRYVPPVVATGNTPESYSAALLKVFDVTNPKGMQSFINKEGQPTQVFYGQDGKVHITLSISSKDQPGVNLPVISMSDTQNHTRFMTRLLGDNQSPTLFMYDSNGKEKLVMGLNPVGPQDPFITLVNQAGKRLNITADTVLAAVSQPAAVVPAAATPAPAPAPATPPAEPKK